MALDETPQQQPVSPPVKVSHKKRWVIIGGVVAAILVIGLLSWWLMPKNDPESNTPTPKKVAVSQVCTPAIIREANGPLGASDQVALAPVVDKIKALKGFDSDPNCLYIVLQYNLVAGDDKASSELMNKLNRVYDPVVGFSNVFTISIIPISELRKNVDFLVRNAKDEQAAQKQADERLSEGSDMADKFYKEHHQ